MMVLCAMGSSKAKTPAETLKLSSEFEPKRKPPAGSPKTVFPLRVGSRSMTVLPPMAIGSSKSFRLTLPPTHK